MENFFPRGRVNFSLHFCQQKFPGCRALLKVLMRSSLLCLFCRQKTLPASLWQRQPCNSEIPDSSLSDTDVSSGSCYHCRRVALSGGVPWSCSAEHSNTTHLRTPRVFLWYKREVAAVGVRVWLEQQESHLCLWKIAESFFNWAEKLYLHHWGLSIVKCMWYILYSVWPRCVRLWILLCLNTERGGTTE